MDRVERWIKGSYASARFDKVSFMVIQKLGQLDVKLIAEDEVFMVGYKSGTNSFDDNMQLNDRITIAYLWILGAYEVVRTLCQCIRSSPEGIPEDVVSNFQFLKRNFSRLRIPLAKNEPASAFKNTDYHFAYPGLTDKGIAWEVSPGLFISRRELADLFLETLEYARLHDPNLPH